MIFPSDNETLGDLYSVPISSLQHYIFCRRQCALIYVEQLWSDNQFTIEGTQLHESVHQISSESRGKIRLIKALSLFSKEIGIHGVSDLLEFHNDPSGEKILPIEYKRGKPKSHRADEVQLCAQALSLEEMFNCRILEGAIYYGERKRRTKILFDDSLRELTLITIKNVRSLICGTLTPQAEYDESKCSKCSLIERCSPKLSDKRNNVEEWIFKMI